MLKPTISLRYAFIQRLQGSNLLLYCLTTSSIFGIKKLILIFTLDIKFFRQAIYTSYIQRIMASVYPILGRILIFYNSYLHKVYVLLSKNRVSVLEKYVIVNKIKKERN